MPSDALGIVTEGQGLKASVIAPAEVPGDVWSGDWMGYSLAVHPRRIQDTLRTPGWQHDVALAVRADRVVGFLPMSTPASAEFPATLFDPRVRAPGLPRQSAAHEYMLIGGHFDLTSGCAVRADEPEPAAVRRVLARTAFDHGRRVRRTALALYVADGERAEWEHPELPFLAEQVSAYAVINLSESSWSGYLASLGQRRRSIVRRDVRDLTREGSRAELTDPAAILAEAVPLMLDVQANHGVTEHPQLIEYRMQRWLAHGAGTAVAFALRAGDGTLLATSFGRHYGTVVEMYEIGLRAGIDRRALAYAETLIYAPLRYVIAHGCAQLRLGWGSIHSKQLRGATVTPVWALTRPLLTSRGTSDRV